MTTFLFLALLASSPVKFQGVSALVLPIPATLSNGLSLPFLGIQDHRIFYLTDDEVHVIADYPADYPETRLKLMKKFPVLTQTEQKDYSHRAVGMLVSQNRVFVLLWANGFENEEGLEINHYLRTYDFEGNLIYSKEVPMKSEVEKGIIKWDSPRSFHFNESGLLEVDYVIRFNPNKVPTREEKVSGLYWYDLETLCFDKKDGRLLSLLQRPIPHPPSLLGGNGLICQTGQDTMSIGSFYGMSICKKGSTSASLKVLIHQMDESFPALLSVPQNDERRGLFVFKVMSNKGEKIGSLTLQLGPSPIMSNATFFTLPGGGFGFVDHFYNGSILKIGHLYTR